VAQRSILRYLRERIATAEAPRSFGHAMTHTTSKVCGAILFGDYRIVATIENDRFVVVVVTVGHRRQVYD
jgi:mRNA interferase RelE/StbE